MRAASSLAIARLEVLLVTAENSTEFPTYVQRRPTIRVLSEIQKALTKTSDNCPKFVVLRYYYTVGLVERWRIVSRLATICTFLQHQTCSFFFIHHTCIFFDQASELIEEGNRALVEQNYVEAVFLYNQALKLDKNLNGEILDITPDTPVTALLDAKRMMGEENFEHPACLDLIEAMQDRCSPILIKRDTISKLTVTAIWMLMGHLQVFSYTLAG